jgi:hypothetical protein
MTFQAFTLASLGLLTLLRVGVSRRALHHIVSNFNCVTFVVRVCRFVICKCAFCKIKSDVCIQTDNF